MSAGDSTLAMLTLFVAALYLLLDNYWDRPNDD